MTLNLSFSENSAFLISFKTLVDSYGWDYDRVVAKMQFEDILLPQVFGYLSDRFDDPLLAVLYDLGDSTMVSFVIGGAKRSLLHISAVETVCEMMGVAIEAEVIEDSFKKNLLVSVYEPFPLRANFLTTQKQALERIVETDAHRAARITFLKRYFKFEIMGALM